MKKSLIDACKNGDLQQVMELVESGHDIFQLEEMPLRTACFNGHLEIVKYLISKGANIYACNSSSLIGSVSSGNLELVQLLFENNKNLYEQQQALNSAIFNAKIEIIEYLISIGANVKYNNSECVSFLLTSAYLYEEVDYIKTIEMLLDNGVDTNLLLEESNDLIIDFIKKYQNNKILNIHLNDTLNNKSQEYLSRPNKHKI